MNAEKDFYSFWADGDADKFSESHLYFSNMKGDKVWELPYRMDREYMKPVLVSSRNDRRPKTEDRAKR